MTQIWTSRWKGRSTGSRNADPRLLEMPTRERSGVRKMDFPVSRRGTRRIEPGDHAASRADCSEAMARRRGLGTAVAESRRKLVAAQSTAQARSTPACASPLARPNRLPTPASTTATGSRKPASTQSSRLPTPCSPIAASTQTIAPLKKGISPSSPVGGAPPARIRHPAATVRELGGVSLTKT
jgi:hypothetical protein